MISSRSCRSGRRCAGTHGGGEPLDPEMHEVLDRLDAGESPDAIEQSMPEVADAAGTSDGGATFEE